MISPENLAKLTWIIIILIIIEIIRKIIKKKK